MTTNKTTKIDLKVGYLCNNDCVHCAINSARSELISKGIATELTTDQVKNLIDLYCKDYQTITLTGGELTVRKDFLDILQYASQRYKFVELQTNGRKLTEKNKLDTLANLNNVVYSIAIHGSTSEIHDAITQRKHSFDQTINSIKQLTKLPNKPHIAAKFVLTNFNKHDILQTVQFVKMLGCQQIDIAYAHGCTDDKQLLKQLLPSYDEVSGLVNQAIRYGKDNNIKVTVETFPLCTIDPENYDCVDEFLLSSISAFVHPVNEELYNWNEGRVHANKTKCNQCNNCCLRNNCEGPWSEYWPIHNGKGLQSILSDKPPLPIVLENRAAKVAGVIKILNEYY